MGPQWGSGGSGTPGKEGYRGRKIRGHRDIRRQRYLTGRCLSVRRQPPTFQHEGDGLGQGEGSPGGPEGGKGVGIQAGAGGGEGGIEPLVIRRDEWGTARLAQGFRRAEELRRLARIARERRDAAQRLEAL